MVGSYFVLFIIFFVIFIIAAWCTQMKEVITIPPINKYGSEEIWIPRNITVTEAWDSLQKDVSILCSENILSMNKNNLGGNI